MNKKWLWFLGSFLALIMFFILGLFVVLSIFIFKASSDDFQQQGDIAYIEISGPIFSSKKIVDDLQNIEDNKSIKGVFLRIDSPGGGVGPSQEIYDAVLRLRPEKKVVVSMGSVAASGGYYIAAAGDVLFANRGTVTGSIGVITDHLNVQELFHFLKLDPSTIKAGQNKDIGNPMRPLSEEDRIFLQRFVDNIHQQFIHDIKKSRKNKIKNDKIAEITDGRIFSGEQALELGLVDKLGNQQAAMDELKRLIGIKKGKANIIYPKKKNIGIFDLTMGEFEQIVQRTYYTMQQTQILYLARGI